MSLFEWIRNKGIPWYIGLGPTRRTVPPRLWGRSCFVSLGGDSSWVRNMREAKGKAAIIPGMRIPVRLVEIPVAERAAVLLAYIHDRAFTYSGSQPAQRILGLSPHPKLEVMEAIADRLVVFEIVPGQQGQGPAEHERTARCDHFSESVVRRSAHSSQEGEAT